MTTTSTHTVTVEWNDKANQPTGPNVSGFDADSLIWPSGKVELISRLSLESRGIRPPRIFKVGDWVRFQNDGREWSTAAHQITTMGADGRYRVYGLPGAWFPDRLRLVG